MMNFLLFVALVWSGGSGFADDYVVDVNFNRANYLRAGTKSKVVGPNQRWNARLTELCPNLEVRVAIEPGGERYAIVWDRVAQKGVSSVNWYAYESHFGQAAKIGLARTSPGFQGLGASSQAYGAMMGELRTGGVEHVTTQWAFDNLKAYNAAIPVIGKELAGYATPSANSFGPDFSILDARDSSNVVYSRIGNPRALPFANHGNFALIPIDYDYEPKVRGEDPIPTKYALKRFGTKPLYGGTCPAEPRPSCSSGVELQALGWAPDLMRLTLDGPDKFVSPPETVNVNATVQAPRGSAEVIRVPGSLLGGLFGWDVQYRYRYHDGTEEVIDPGRVGAVLEQVDADLRRRQRLQNAQQGLRRFDATPSY